MERDRQTIHGRDVHMLSSVHMFYASKSYLTKIDPVAVVRLHYMYCVTTNHSSHRHTTDICDAPNRVIRAHANRQVQHDPLQKTDKTEACMKTPAVPPVQYPPSQETAVHAYVRPAPHTAPKRIHACEDRQGKRRTASVLHTCLLPRCAALQMCICIIASPKREPRPKRIPVHARLGRGYVRWRMEKEWASVGMRWMTAVVGSHGCSRLWARAPRMFLPGERFREYIFVGD